MTSDSERLWKGAITNVSIVKAIEELNYEVSIDSLMLHTGENYSIQDGDDDTQVTYYFSKNLQIRISQASWSASLHQWLNTWKDVIFSIVRALFGMCLILSLLLIVIIAIVIIIAASSQDRSSGGGSSILRRGAARHARGNGLSFSDIYFIHICCGDNPFFFYHQPPRWRRDYQREVQDYRWRAQVAQQPNYRYRVAATESSLPVAVPVEEESEESLLNENNDDISIPTAEPVPEMMFLHAIFSFVFGDGHPGPSESCRWKIIAAIIRRFNGVVAIELLMPFFVPETEKLDNTALSKDLYKKQMLSVLCRFGGVPVPVRNSDEYVYYFRKLAYKDSGDSVTIDVDQAALDLSQVPYFHENQWTFSLINENQFVQVGLLGFFNIFGILWVKRQLDTPGVVPLDSDGSVYACLYAIVCFFVTYAIMFFVIPLLRFIVHRILNAKLNKRNELRKNVGQYLDNELNDPESKLSAKLRFAEQYP